MVLINNATASTTSRCGGILDGQRRRVVGVDLWEKCPEGADAVVAEGLSRAAGTHLRLSDFATADTARATKSDEIAELSLRFVTRRDDAHATGEAVSELLAKLPRRRRWAKLSELEEFGAAAAFVALDSL